MSGALKLDDDLRCGLVEYVTTPVWKDVRFGGRYSWSNRSEEWNKGKCRDVVIRFIVDSKVI